jgi:hypothetical protein
MMGIVYEPKPLKTRYNDIEWPGGKVRLVYTGQKIDLLESAYLPDGTTFSEKSHAKGRTLFVSLPLELNGNLDAVGEVYRHPLNIPGVAKTYSTDAQSAGILIAPVRFPHATLYVLSSETNQPGISFRDERSGKQFSAQLEPGRAALLLIGEKGDLLGSFNWSERH